MTEMIEIKTDDLIGRALDWAVAVAQGETPSLKAGWSIVFVHYTGYRPSESWVLFGSIIEKSDWALPYRATARYHLGAYESCTPGGFPHNGPTPLIAGCRAIVAGALGSTVSVPKELMP